MRIYVAGPYTPLNEDKHVCIREAAQNVHQAIVVAITLLDKGHIPFIPHLSHFIHTNPVCQKEYSWYKIDNTHLEHWAEALFYIAPSKGADAELALAKKLGLKIFYSLEEVPNNDN